VIECGEVDEAGLAEWLAHTTDDQIRALTGQPHSGLTRKTDD
jgi:hypothetical protein